MTAESAGPPAPRPGPCPACGAPAQGKFCSECGAPLGEQPANAYLLFVDSFLKIGDLRRYAGRYARILRSPVAATLEMFETSTLSDALRFLEYSVGILVLIFLSRVLVFPGDLLSGFLTNVYFVLAQSVGLLLHYRLAVIWVRRRGFAEFMRLAAIFYGFTLPISGLLQAVSLSHRTAGSILFLIFTAPLLVYAVRVWKRFWDLPAWAVFLLLFFSSLLGLLVGLAFIFLVGLFSQGFSNQTPLTGSQNILWPEEVEPRLLPNDLVHVTKRVRA